jgi:hypothetical protein
MDNTIYRSDIIDIKIKSQLDQYKYKGEIKFYYNYYLNVDTKKGIFYFIFETEIEAERAKKKIELSHHFILDENNHDFNTVKIFYPNNNKYNDIKFIILSTLAISLTTIGYVKQKNSLFCIGMVKFLICLILSKYKT